MQCAPLEPRTPILHKQKCCKLALSALACVILVGRSPIGNKQECAQCTSGGYARQGQDTSRITSMCFKRAHAQGGRARAHCSICGMCSGRENAMSADPSACFELIVFEIKETPISPPWGADRTCYVLHCKSLLNHFNVFQTRTPKVGGGVGSAPWQ